MNTLLRTLKGSSAFAALIGLLAGIPWGLVHFMGWPLPTKVPSFAGLWTSLGQSGVPDSVLLGGLAVALWLLWLAFATAVVTESVAAVCGGVARHVVGGPFQLAAASLVGIIVMSLSSGVTSSSSTPRVDLRSVVQPMPAMSLAVATSGVATPSPMSVVPTAVEEQPEYVVIRHDTLWGISERYLGNPQRWREIFQLNEGRVQPDGRSLVNGDRIYPGWRLVLPSDAAVVAPVVQEATSEPTAAAVASAEPEVSVATISPTHVGEHVVASSGGGDHATISDAGPVEATLGPVSGDVGFVAGSVVAASLGLAISGFLVRLKSRRRRRYVPGEVGPGVAVVGNADHKGVGHLVNLPADDDESSDEVAVIAYEPGEVSLGTVDGNERVIDVSRAGVTVISGSDALAQARSLVVNFVASYDVDRAEVVVVGDSLADDLVGSSRVLGISVVGDADAALRRMSVEVLRRRRLIDEREVNDIVALRVQLPEEALAATIVVARSVGEDADVALGALGEQGSVLGIGVVFIAEREPNEDRGEKTFDAVPVPEHETYRLEQEDASAVVAMLGEVRHFDDENVVYALVETESFEPPDEIEAVGDRVRLSVMGVERISYRGEEVRAGLRRSAWELAAFLSLRPHGATKDAVVEAIWPNRKRAAADDLFRVSLSNLRQTLRGITGQSAQFVELANDRYRLDRQVIECDLWDFERGLDGARRARNEELPGALERVVGAYVGSFVEGASYGWAEEVRQDLRNRVLDCISKLAELAESDGDDELALTHLEKAIEVEPYAEELYSRAMRIQARMHRRDAVTRTMRRLERALEDLGLEPTMRTRSEYRSFVG